MESKNPGDYDPVAAAARLNAALANDLARFKRWRLTTAVILIGLGIGALFIKQTIIFAPPCLIGAFIMFLLYFDARGQLREVKSRNWASPTPRVSQLGRPRAKSPETAARG